MEYILLKFAKDICKLFKFNIKHQILCENAKAKEQKERENHG